VNTEIFWLFLTAILASSMWIPYIIGVNTTAYDGPAGYNSFLRPPDHRSMVPWVHRAYRAHQNLHEQFMPLAVIALIGMSLNVSTPIMGWCAIAFFWLRVAHAIGMISGLAQMPVRPLIFTSGWIVTMIYAWQVFAHVPNS
jgi:uncharacterized MAPEG superfamily protein